MKKIKIITLVLNKETGEFDTTKFNEFLANNIVEKTDDHFFQIENNVYWTYAFHYECENYVSKKTQIIKKAEIKNDIFSGLTEKEKLLFQKLKLWRNEKAKSEGINSFIICHNTQLVEITKIMPDSLEKLKTINGIGKQKAEKYGKEILEIIKNKDEGNKNTDKPN